MKTALRPLQFVSAREVSAAFSSSLLAFGSIVLAARRLAMAPLGESGHSTANGALMVAGVGSWVVPHIISADGSGLA